MMVDDLGEAITIEKFRVIPVIDWKGRRAVHAVGGRRDQYRPLESVWQADGSPISLAGRMCSALGLDTIYLADLDAIAGEPPSVAMYRSIVTQGLTLWVDPGVRERDDLEALADLERDPIKVVVGLESVAGPIELARLIERAGADRVIFSLDLVGGQPKIATGASWSSAEPPEIARRAIDCGVQQIIVLDLARVGTGRGIGTDRLLGQILERDPTVAVTVGGGTSGIEDIAKLKSAGAASVLVGSAIHDGRIGPVELNRLHSDDLPSRRQRGSG